MATRTYGSQNQGLLVMRNVDFTNPANGKGTDQMTIPGQILIATGAAFPAAQIVANTLTAGAGISIVNGPGTITISATLVGGVDVDAATAPGTDPVVPNGLGFITVTGAQIAANSTANVIRTNSVLANQYRIEIQRSSAIAASTIARNGVCHFNSAQFTVDANGFVSLAGGGLAVDTIGVQASTAPGTNPVVPTAGGLITVLGAVVTAAGTPVRTNSIIANQYRIEVQAASQQVGSAIANAGLSSFNSAQFSVDANGWVSIVPGAGSINITPDAGLNVTNSAFSLTAVAVASGIVPIRTNGTALNALQIEVQRAGSSVATNATQQGIASFNSANFSVDANGWVSAIAGPGSIDITPTAGVNVTNSTFSLLASISTPATGNPFRTFGVGGNSIIVETQVSSAQAVSSLLNAGLCSFDSSQFTVDAVGWVSNLNGLPSSSFDVQANTAPGTDPVLPSALGVVQVNGTIVSAHAIPIRTNSLAANSFDVEVQYASAQAVDTASASGMCHFDSAAFTVSPTGFVQLAGGGLAIDSINVDVATPPGTDPVLPDAGGQVTITGGQVAAGTTANVLRSHSTALNSLTIEVQRSSAQAVSTLAANGVSHFSSAQFSVDGNGFVTMANGLPVSGVDVQANTPPGTDPVLPNALGIIAVSGAQVAAAAIPIQTNSIAANSYEIQVQRSSAQAVSTLSANGICHFNSGQFSVDANGFVSSLVGAAPWLDVAAPAALANHTGYFVTAAGAVTLPAGAANGDMIEIVDQVGGGVVVTASGADIIQISNVASSAGGTATSTQKGDALRLVFRLADLTWYCCPGAAGNWNLA